MAKFEIIKNTKIKNYFDKHIYIFKYEGIIRNAIINYKFNEKSYIYKTFVNFIINNKKTFEILKSYDKIMAVPISSNRYKKRGYNQSYLIAKQLAKQTKLECDNESLIKIKNIIEQSKLNKEQRANNIKGAFKITNIKNIQNKNIVLIDDIYTTGSTVNECCKTLKNAGANKIIVLTIAKD